MLALAFRITAILIAGFLLSWVITFTVRVDPMYRSIHSVGERFSHIVPRGYDKGAHNFEAQYVRVEPSSYYNDPAELLAKYDLDLDLKPNPRTDIAKREQLIVPGVGIMIVIASLITIVICRRNCIERLRGGGDGSFTRLTLGLTAMCVLSVGALLCFRLFLTGVDDGLIKRAAIGSAQAQSYYEGNLTLYGYYDANLTLSMSFTSLMMVYIGVGITLYTVLTWFGLRMWTSAHQEYPEVERNVGYARMRTLRWAGYATLACTSTLLILAPWTNTMLGKFFS